MTQDWQPTAAHAASEIEEDDLDSATGLVVGIIWCAVLTMAIIIVGVFITRL